MKVFQNGNIQMTGIKSFELGENITNELITILKNIHMTKNPLVVTDIASVAKSDYRVCLINSDFRVGFQIKRDNLFKLMTQEFNNICSYEPCIYPGVKIQYFWNSESYVKDGVCNCPMKCHLKKKSGDGHGVNNCKKITLSVFQSGAIIITGSQMTHQIDECYDFINNILYKNIDKIEKKIYLPQAPKVQCA